MKNVDRFVSDIESISMEYVLHQRKMFSCFLEKSNYNLKLEKIHLINMVKNKADGLYFLDFSYEWWLKDRTKRHYIKRVYETEGDIDISYRRIDEENTVLFKWVNLGSKDITLRSAFMDRICEFANKRMVNVAINPCSFFWDLPTDTIYNAPKDRTPEERVKSSEESKINEQKVKQLLEEKYHFIYHTEDEWYIRKLYAVDKWELLKWKISKAFKV